MKSPADAPLSLGALLLCARRRPGTLLGTTAAAIALAGLFVRFQEPVFESEATIHVDVPSMAGVFGELGRIADLSSPGVGSEIAALRTRALAEESVRGIEGVPVPTPSTPGYDRHVGLTTLVSDDELSLYSVLFRRFAPHPADGRPYVIPAGRLFASLTTSDEDAPRRVRVTFLTSDRVRLSTPSMRSSLFLGGGHPSELAFTPGTPIEYRGATLRLVPRGVGAGRSFVVERWNEYEAVERLMDRTRVGETSRGSGVLRIAVRDSDPRRAYEALSAVCNNYLDEVGRRTRKSPDLSVDYISRLIEAQEQSFARAQEEILRVQRETPEVLVVDEVAGDLVRQISALELRRVRIETGQTALEGITESLKEGDLTALARLDGAGSAGLMGSLGLTVDPLTESYVAQIAELKAEVLELEQVFEQDYPPLRDLRAQVDGLVAAIRAQLIARSENLRSDLRDATARRDELRASLLELPRNSAQLVQPKLAVAVYEELLPFLLQSLHAAEISTSAADLSADFFDRPSLPSKLAAPNVTRLALTAAALGLLLGLVIAFARERRRNA